MTVFSSDSNWLKIPFIVIFFVFLSLCCLLQLLYVEAEEPRSTHNALPIRSSITPTKKVDVDRTVMPDGTIVTTVTTVQSRLKLERSPGVNGIWQRGHNQPLFYCELKCKILFVVTVTLVLAYQL